MEELRLPTITHQRLGDVEDDVADLQDFVRSVAESKSFGTGGDRSDELTTAIAVVLADMVHERKMLLQDVDEKYKDEVVCILLTKERFKKGGVI